MYNGSRLKNIMSEALQPLWFKLPKRFYRKLAAISTSAGLHPEDCLEFALEITGALAVAAHAHNLSLKEFIGQLKPRIRAWQKETDSQDTTLIQALADGAKLYHMYGPLEGSKTNPEGGPIRKSPATLAILRWANVPASERSDQARKLAQKRWAAKKNDIKKTVGEKGERGEL